MSAAKRFLAIYFVVYLVGAISAVCFWGPPGLSREYLDQGSNRQDHDRYLEVIKSEEYKLFVENPGKHPALGQLEADVAYVEDYSNRPAFKAEERRAEIYGLFFDFYNATAVIILMVRFGKKPLLGFLDEKIGDIRERISRAEDARAAAAAMKAEAGQKLAGVDEEKRRIVEQAEELAHNETVGIEEMTQAALAQIDEETEQRKKLEERRAAMQVKQELVEKSIDVLSAKLKAETTSRVHNTMFDEFLARLEQLK